jgi:hypothetical protein
VIVVADSTPLIILAKLCLLDLLPRLYTKIYVSREVYEEVVVAGAGLPGAAAVASADPKFNSESVPAKSVRSFWPRNCVLIWC